MRQSSLNFVVDMVGLVLLIGLTVTGSVMKWVLLPGSGGRQGGGGEHVKTLLSLGRHDWGGIHFWLAGAFVLLVVVHIAMHYNWIKRYLTKQQSS